MIDRSRCGRVIGLECKMSKWKTVKLGDVFVLQMGKTPARDKSAYWNNGDHKWVSIADISKAGKYIEKTKETISNGAVAESGIKVIPRNTVIMSFKLSIGKTCITTEDIYSNEAIMAFICNGTCQVDNTYLFHLFSTRDWSKGTNKAVMGTTLNKATLNNIEIPLPPLKEQKRIADILDKAAELISLRKQQIEKLDLLVKSKFIDMFGDPVTNPKGWEKKKLIDVATTRLGKMLDAKQQTGKYVFPYLANFNVQWFRFNMTRLNQMDFAPEDQIEFELKDGDLLICEGGEVGRAAIWRKAIEKCFFQKALHRVRCDFEIVAPEYLAFVFYIRATKTGFSEVVGGSSTISHLTGEKLKLLLIPIPPLKLQNEFAAFVEKVEKQKTQMQTGLEKLELNYKALMVEFFEGE